MKRILVMLLLCIGTFHLTHAQNWNEWFRQKKTQRKYLLQQIGALQVYIDFARKGYQIVGDGLNVIGKIKKGDFDLHDVFFASLKAVNPRIKNYVKVAASISLQVRITKETSKTIRAMRESGQFTTEEISYCEKVIERLFTDCLACINELYSIITDQELELKDDERIKHIDRLYTEMQSKYSFCANFSEEVGVLAMQRKSESIEINFSKIINDIP